VKFPTGLRLSGNLSGLNFRGAEIQKDNKKKEEATPEKERLPL